MRINAPWVKLFKQRQHKFRLVDNGITAVAVSLHHIHSIDMMGTACGDLNNLGSEYTHQVLIFTFGVADQNIVTRSKCNKDNQFFYRERFTTTGNAEDKCRLIEKIGFIAKDKVAGDSIDTVKDTACVHNFLHTERHQHRQALGG